MFVYHTSGVFIDHISEVLTDYTFIGIFIDSSRNVVGEDH